MNSLEVLTARFASKDAEIAYYREREWLIVDARDSLVDDDDMAELEQLPEFERLLVLNLAGSKVTNRSVRSIAKCVQLESLDLGHTQCDERSLESVIGLRELKGLGLAGIRLEKQFAFLLLIPNLDVLDLSESRPTKEQTRSILSSTNVSILKVPGNGFEPDDFLDMDELEEDSRIVSIELDNDVRIHIERPRLA